MGNTNVTQNPEEKTVRILPPKEFFTDGGELMARKEQGSVAGQLTTNSYHAHVPPWGGIWLFHVGDKYPHKAWPFKEAVWANDCIKRPFMRMVKFLLSKPLRYFLPLFGVALYPFRKKIMREALRGFTDAAFIIYDRWGVRTWQTERFCDMAREMFRAGLATAGSFGTLTMDVLSEMGMLVFVVCMFFEFDDAYRYFTQDIAELVNISAAISNPRRELMRVVKIASERCDPGVKDNMLALARMLSVMLLIPEVKRAAIAFFWEVDLEKIKLDYIDWYRCLLWGNYKFRGIPAEDRASMRIMEDAEWENYMRKSKKTKEEWTMEFIYNEQQNHAKVETY